MLSLIRPASRRRNTRFGNRLARRPKTLRLPRLENLETRSLMTTMVMIDFDGATRAELDQTVSQMRTYRDQQFQPNGIAGFTEGITSLDASEYSFLDLDRDGTLTRNDAEIAIGRMMDLVREDFAPYDVQVMRQDVNPDALLAMRNNAAGDTLVFVQSHDGCTHIPNYDPELCIGGQMPIDYGNRSDNAGAVGQSLEIARWANGFSWFTDAEKAIRFVQTHANLISHEVGHSFGLNHVDTSESAGTDGRNLMDGTPYDRNLGFWDFDVALAAGGTQNQHTELTRVLGASPRGWAAVTRPGELTIQGSGFADQALVRQDGDVWSVLVVSGSERYEQRIDPNANPLWTTANEFPEAITTIRFVGGDGDDYLSVDGTITADVEAWAGAGNDLIVTGAGDDVVYGQQGDDNIETGGGNDRIEGDDGRDELHGGHGDDTISGGSGVDELYGDVGKDWLYGGEHTDWIYGGRDRDIIFGGAGNDLLYGERGNDIIFGDGGNDQIYGGAGKDRLYGGLGDDRVWGESGRDRLYGGQGNDMLDGGEDRDRLLGDAGDDWLYGKGGDDEIRGGSGSDRLYGGSGDDRLRGQAGNDFLYGEDGDDTLIGGTGADQLSGGPGRTTFG